MEEFQKYFFQITFHHHFQARNAKISPIFHFDCGNNGRICHILCVKTITTEKLENQNFELINNLFSLSIAALDNNNEMYKSHVELKRRIVELCIQAVLADMKDSNANTNDIYAMAEAQCTRNKNFIQKQKINFINKKKSFGNEKFLSEMEKINL